MSLIPSYFFDAVCAIGQRDSAQQMEVLATGFLYGHLIVPPPDPNTPNYVTYLVTNRHVVEGKTTISLRFNTKGTTPSRILDLPLFDDDGSLIYAVHPDPEIDIAAITISVPLLRFIDVECSFFSSDHSLTLGDAANAGVAEGNGVFLLGFPLGDAGKDRNFVVARHGIIARIGDATAGASKHFLADVAVFPGSSGSPLVTKPELVSISGTKAHARASLIGVVAGFIPYTDIAISAQTKHARITFEENSGLAIVYPIDQVEIVVGLAQGIHDARVAKKAVAQTKAPQEAEPLPPERSAENEAETPTEG